MSRFRLARKERRALGRFINSTKDKLEYVRAVAILMRAKGKKVREVVDALHVSMSAVFKWESNYRKHGLSGLVRRRPPGRPPRKKGQARKLIPELMKKDPRLFGFLKGRWVVRDIAKALKGEGVEISSTQVHGILHELGLSYKRPKLSVKSPDPWYSRKARMVQNYKQIAPALEKRG